MVLGPPQPICHQKTEDGVPVEQAVSLQKLRPGSGILSLRVHADGPTRVLEVTDRKLRVNIQCRQMFLILSVTIDFNFKYLYINFTVNLICKTLWNQKIYGIYPCNFKPKIKSSLLQKIFTIPKQVDWNAVLFTRWGSPASQDSITQPQQEPESSGLTLKKLNLQ